MKRYVHTQMIASALQRVIEHPEAAAHILYELLVANLPDGLRKVYDLACEKGALTTADVMAKFGWENNHASTILKELATLGLLSREKKVDGRGLFYEYKVKNVNSG